MNDLPDEFANDTKTTLFADDSNISFSVSNYDQAVNRIEAANSSLSTWAARNGLQVNKDKTAVLIFKNNEEEVKTKFLGVLIDSNLRFNFHVDEVCKKLRSAVFCLSVMSSETGPESLR